MATKTASVCIGCRFANWDKTESGRLHPSGGGMCTWTVTVPVAQSTKTYSLPSRAIKSSALTLSGGRIDRWKRRFTIGEETCAVKEVQPKSKDALIPLGSI